MQRAWLVVLWVLLVSTRAGAQPSDESSGTGAASATSRYRVSPQLGVTTVADGNNVVPVVGASALLGMGGSFALGFGVSALRYDREQGYLRGQRDVVYGGLALGWSLLRDAPIHPTLQLTFGPGHQRKRGEFGSGSDTFIAIEPSAGAEVNATRYLRLGLAATARAGLMGSGHSIGNGLGGVGARLQLSLGRF